MAKRHRGITPEQAQVIRLRESGLSWSKIASQMGMRRDACCVLYGRAQKELARRAGLEKIVSDYRDEGRRSVYAKQRKRAERELEKAKSLDGVPMKHKPPQPLPVPLIKAEPNDATATGRIAPKGPGRRERAFVAASTTATAANRPSPATPCLSFSERGSFRAPEPGG